MNSGQNFLPRLGSSVSVALETNGKGFLGYIVELPGAFIRGRTEQEALGKISPEVNSYLRWLGNDPGTFRVRARFAQRHRCKLTIEDADTEILLDADKGDVTPEEFDKLKELAMYSGRTFVQLYDNARFKDWVDEARIRKTFYGDNKKTIREIFDHVKRTQYYYLSRAGLPIRENEKEDFAKIRRSCFQSITALFAKDRNSRVYNIDNEEWTIKKVLRRFIWHDRIHGKAIARILEKQKQMEMIDSYQDPFHFTLSSPAC